MTCATGGCLSERDALLAVFARLAARFGPLGWWPAETAFEVCVGAILTQNTAWGNVEKAIANLRQADVLQPEALHALAPGELAELIRPSGFFNVKSRRLKAFVGWLHERHDGSLDRMFAGEWRSLRAELLQVPGIGPETCDSILLYAGHKPTFVVDAYTRRLFGRLGLTNPVATYDELRNLFMTCLGADVPLFNEYHALIVEQCKQVCRSRPRCGECVLAERCPTAHEQVLPAGR